MRRDLRRSYTDYLENRSHEPVIVDIVNEFLEDTLVPLMQTHLFEAFSSSFISHPDSSESQSIRRNIAKQIRSELDGPITRDVRADMDRIKERIRAEYHDEVRANLKEELRDDVIRELREELMRKLIE